MSGSSRPRRPVTCPTGSRRPGSRCRCPLTVLWRTYRYRPRRCDARAAGSQTTPSTSSTSTSRSFPRCRWQQPCSRARRSWGPFTPHSDVPCRERSPRHRCACTWNVSACALPCRRRPAAPSSSTTEETPSSSPTGLRQPPSAGRARIRGGWPPTRGPSSFSSAASMNPARG